MSNTGGAKVTIAFYISLTADGREGTEGREKELL